MRTCIAAGSCNALQLQNKHVIWRNLNLNSGTENISHLEGKNNGRIQWSKHRTISKQKIPFVRASCAVHGVSVLVVIKVICCAASAFQTSSPQSFSIASLRIIKCLAWWKEVSVVPYTALKLSWATVLRCYPEVFSNDNAMVISTSSRKCQHILVEASGMAMDAICRRGAEIINIFWFSQISAFFAEICYFLRKTRLLSNLTRTPCIWTFLLSPPPRRKSNSRPDQCIAISLANVYHSPCRKGMGNYPIIGEMKNHWWNIHVSFICQAEPVSLRDLTC